MGGRAIEIIFFVSGVLCVAWIITNGIKTVRLRKRLEREVYLKHLEKMAELAEQEQPDGVPE